MTRRGESSVAGKLIGGTPGVGGSVAPGTAAIVQRIEIDNTDKVLIQLLYSLLFIYLSFLLCNAPDLLYTVGSP